MGTAQKMMGQINANKELVRQAYDALNKGDIDEFGNLLSDDFHENTPKGRTLDKDAYLADVEAIKRAMPDMKFEIQEVIAEGDNVVVVQEFCWTLIGEMQGMEPTGKGMSVKEIDVYKVVDGKLAELSSVFDSLSMWSQLGIWIC